VANMTGNVVFLGFALAGASGVTAAASLIALGSFLAGALLGGLLGARTSEHRGHMLRAAAAAQLGLMALALILALTLSTPLGADARRGVLALLACAMGVQNAAAQRLAVPELTTTVLTRTLTGLASEAGLVGGRGAHLGRRAVAVGAMLAGAVVGGLLALHTSVAAALAAASAIVLAIGLVVHFLSTGTAAWTRSTAP